MTCLTGFDRAVTVVEIPRTGGVVLRKSSRLACFAMISLASLPAQAKDPACMSISALFQQKLPSLGANKWNGITLKRDGQARHLILTEIPGEPTNAAKWLVATRESEERPENYCIQATGSEVNPLQSMHDWKSAERFGLPGSGQPRCGDAGDPLEGLKVRGWASKELGRSLILSLDSPGPKEPTFVVLTSIVDGAWVLLGQEPGGPTCYFDRGSESSMKAFSVKR